MEAKQITIRNFVVSVLGVLFLEFFMRWALPYHPMIVLGLVRLLQVILVMASAAVWDRGMRSFGMDQAALLLGFKRGLLWSAGFAILCCIILFLLYLADLNVLQLLRTRLPRKPPDIALFFLVGGIIAPVTEEIFFRGLVYGFLRRWGFPVALVLSTFFFVVVHPAAKGVPFTQIVGGLLFAVAYELEGNLVVPITIHALGNLALFSLSLIFSTTSF